MSYIEEFDIEAIKSEETKEKYKQAEQLLRKKVFTVSEIAHQTGLNPKEIREIKRNMREKVAWRETWKKAVEAYERKLGIREEEVGEEQLSYTEMKETLRQPRVKAIADKISLENKEKALLAVQDLEQEFDRAKSLEKKLYIARVIQYAANRAKGASGRDWQDMRGVIAAGKVYDKSARRLWDKYNEAKGELDFASFTRDELRKTAIAFKIPKANDLSKRGLVKALKTKGIPIRDVKGFRKRKGRELF